LWQTSGVSQLESTNPMARKLIASLHVEAMVFSDEARSYFDGFELAERMELSPRTRVVFSCEALKVTTRLMHSVAWLLSHRAAQNAMPSVLGHVPLSDHEAIADLPEEALRIIAASEDLHARIARLAAGLWETDIPASSPAFRLQQRLAYSMAVQTAI
jgi:regulator of CtrA degradation